MRYCVLQNSIVTSLILFLTLSLSSIGSAAQIKLAWNPNIEPDLAGYKVYCGTASGAYGTPINVGNVTTYTLTGLTNGQTYFIAVTAYDTSGNESSYSDEVSGTANESETVSTPSVLAGPTTGTTGTSYSYSTGGSSSNLGHSVEYQFDWKGTASDLSPWGSATQSKTWASAGTYNVRSRARCTIHTNIVSNWSSSLSVAISAGPQSYTVTTNPSGLQITVDGVNYTAPQTFSWTPGSTHKLSVSSPQNGTSGTRYVYSSWSDSGGQTHTITVPSSGTTYRANFTTQYSLTTSASPSAGGAVSPSGTNWHNSAQSVSVSAKANAGYTFPNWSGDLSGSTNPTSISMNGAKNVVANFKQIQYSLTININPSGSGSVSKSPDKPTYVYGDQVTLTTTANSGYAFKNWSGDVTGTTNPITLTINGNKTVTANFSAPETISTSTAPSGATTGITNTSYTYTTGGSSSSYGHSVEYRFDWGDGSYSNWSSLASASKSWTSVGTYLVSAQARCAQHTSVVSSWSGKRVVDIRENIPPTPNPMTWVTVPHQTGINSISMVATTVTDPTPPISYYFDFVSSPTGGLGGADSGWQPGTSYTNPNLRANQKYGYRVKAKDGFNNQTAYSTTQYAFTAIQTPTGITFGTITPTRIQVRSTNTLTGLSWGSSGLWIENTTNTTNSGWKRDNTPWTSKSLSPNTSYSFRAKARNGNGIETAYGPPASKYTRANLPGRASFSDVTRTSIRANWTANGNPDGTEYQCQNVTTGAKSDWTSNTYWDFDNLACSISYSFRVKAKNREGIETGWTSLGSQSTVKCIVLLKPNGGEMIPSGSTYDIQWDSTPLAESFDLFYSLDSGVSWISIAKDVRNTIHSWTVPKTIGNKKACFVRVIGYNGARTKQIGSDTSDKPFTIEVLTVIKPNGGELLHAGEDLIIEWRGCSDVVKLDLMVSFDSGATWRFIDDKGTPGIIEGKGATGTTLNTKVPSPGTGNRTTCLIKVIAYNGAGKLIGSDASDKPFTIEVVKLTFPNGGGPTLKQSDTVNITWTAYETSEPITKVQLFYTDTLYDGGPRDVGLTWELITTLSGSYLPGNYGQSWTVLGVGTTPRTNCKVKVVLSDAKGVIRGSDMSDAFFAIEP
jgi:hypothetical protein